MLFEFCFETVMFRPNDKRRFESQFNLVDNDVVEVFHVLSSHFIYRPTTLFTNPNVFCVLFCVFAFCTCRVC